MSNKEIIIANPIYDSVFKYLLEDKKVAKIILETLLEEEIVELDFASQEYTELKKQEEETTGSLAMTLKLDFAAMVRKPNGDLEKIMIEVQKAKVLTDIKRFRRYISTQYRNDSNILVEEINGTKIKTAIPIKPIYFLNYSLNNFKEIGIFDIKRLFIDKHTGTILEGKDPFIEGISHDAIVICVNNLPKNAHTKLEKMLQIFQQDSKDSKSKFLKVNGDLYPKEYRAILQRLKNAATSEEIRNKIEMEESFLESYEEMQLALEKKDSMLLEKDEVIEEKDQVIVEKDQVIELERQKREELEELTLKLKQEIEKLKGFKS